ncbi:MAG: hypothetical protein ACOC8N_08490 [Spirochaetota bacterium]
MNSRRIDQKIVPIDWVDDEERWILVPPGGAERRRRRRDKQIVYKKQRCLFAAGVPRSIIDFTYRAVKKLGLTDRVLIFSRGTVRAGGVLTKREVSIHELDWGVGTLLTIPRALRYGDQVTVQVEGIICRIRLMELAVLEGLLKLVPPGGRAQTCRATAARVIAFGWSRLA